MPSGDGRDLAVQLVGRLGVPADAGGGLGHVEADRVGDRLARVEGLDEAELARRSPRSGPPSGRGSACGRPGLRRDQRPSSAARRAAATATSTSAGPPCATSAIGRPVAGFSVDVPAAVERVAERAVDEQLRPRLSRSIVGPRSRRWTGSAARRRSSGEVSPGAARRLRDERRLAALRTARSHRSTRSMTARARYAPAGRERHCRPTSVTDRVRPAATGGHRRAADRRPRRCRRRRAPRHRRAWRDRQRPARAPRSASCFLRPRRADDRFTDPVVVQLLRHADHARLVVGLGAPAGHCTLVGVRHGRRRHHRSTAASADNDTWIAGSTPSPTSRASPRRPSPFIPDDNAGRYARLPRHAQRRFPHASRDGVSAPGLRQRGRSTSPDAA